MNPSNETPGRVPAPPGVTEHAKPIGLHALYGGTGEANRRSQQVISVEICAAMKHLHALAGALERGYIDNITARGIVTTLPVCERLANELLTCQLPESISITEHVYWEGDE